MIDKIQLENKYSGDFNMNTDYLKEFEEMNHTTESVFDSGFNGVLIILKDGTNLTSWSEVEDSDDILYISADFRWKENYNEFKTFRNAKAVIIQNYTFPRQSLGSLFSNPPLIFKLSHLDSLESFYAINWDTSELNRSNDLFAHCYSLEYLSSKSRQ